MKDHELVLLHAKDRVVKVYGRIIVAWSKKTWQDKVESVLSNINDDDIPRIKAIYEDKA